MSSRLIACFSLMILTAGPVFPQAEEMGDRMFESAVTAYREGNLRKAIEIFEAILREVPSYSGIWNVRSSLGIAYYQADRHGEAITTFQKIMDQCPDPRFKEEAGLLIAGAETALAGARLKPEDGSAERARAFAPGIAAYRSFLKKYPESKSRPDACYGLAMAQYQADDLDGAEQTLGEFSQLPDRSTFEVEAEYLLARVYAAQASKLSADPKRPDAKAEARKRREDAEKLFVRISQNQKSIVLANDALRAAGEMLIKAEEYRRALKYLNQIQSTARLIEQQRNFIGRIDAAIKAALLQKNTGRVNELEKQRDREMRRLEMLRGKSSTFLVAQLLLIQCNLNLKRYEEGLLLARRYYPAFDSDQKKFCSVFVMMAFIEQKDVEAAIARYQEFKTSYPGDKIAERIPSAIAETGLAIKETDPKTRLPRRYFNKADAATYYHDIVKTFPNSPWAEKARERLKAIGPIAPATGAPTR